MSLRIDTVAPVVMPGDHGDTPRTVTPNGDTVGETVAVPFAVSEASTVTATIAGPDGATVRTLSTTATTAARRHAGTAGPRPARPVPDGRYTVTLARPRHRGQRRRSGRPSTSTCTRRSPPLTRSPAQLYPQDGDALRQVIDGRVRRCSSRATRHRQGPRCERDGGADRVRRPRRCRPAPQHWAWNGKVAGGAYAKPGTYRIVVSATNGTQRAAQSTSVLADAFRLEASVTDAVRGHAFTLTARSTEPLSTTPVVVVREAGVASWTVAMTKASGGDVDGDDHPEARPGPRGRSGSRSRPGTRPAARNASTLRLGLR